MRASTLKAILCIFTLLVIGIILAASGWNHLRNNALLDQTNAVIEGKVIDGFISTGSRGGKWFHLVVEYQPVNHAPITRKFDVDGQTYDASLATRTTTVTYRPEKPKVSRVTRFAPLPFQIIMWLGCIITLGGFIALAHFIKTRDKVTPTGTESRS